MTDKNFLELVFSEIRRVRTDGGDLDTKHLLAAVSAYQSEDWDAIALKLAIWRWARMSPDGVFHPELSIEDRVVYSAFRDALELSGRNEYATDQDEKTEFLAELLSSAA